MVVAPSVADVPRCDAMTDGLWKPNGLDQFFNAVRGSDLSTWVMRQVPVKVPVRNRTIIVSTHRSVCLFFRRGGVVVRVVRVVWCCNRPYSSGYPFVPAFGGPIRHWSCRDS